MENLDNPIPGLPEHQAELSTFANAVQQIRTEVGKTLVGQTQMVDLIVAALFSNGHVLIEGVPGIAKTLTAKLLARCLDLQFSRIQFTPDLMPADVTGTSIFNVKTQDFEFRKGPVFANVVLIDEINRSPAKTQAALFEVMEEGQITTDGTPRMVPQPFMVLATQNPIEQEGTYKLPEAQQDRFMMKIIIGYPTLEEESEILQRFSQPGSGHALTDIKPVLNSREIQDIRDTVSQVHISKELMKYVAGVVHATRSHKDLYLGASPRASLAIMRCSKVIAAMNGRNFVTPDDIRFVTFPVLNHRLILTPESEMEGVEIRQVVDEILKTVEIPR